MSLLLVTDLILGQVEVLSVGLVESTELSLGVFFCHGSMVVARFEHVTIFDLDSAHLTGIVVIASPSVRLIVLHVMEVRLGHLVTLRSPRFLNQRFLIKVDRDVHAPALIISDLNLIELAASASVRPSLCLFSLGLNDFLNLFLFVCVVLLLEVAIVESSIDAGSSMLVLVKTVGDSVNELLQHLPVAKFDLVLDEVWHVVFSANVL